MQSLIIKESNCWELQTPSEHFWTEECLSSAPLKNEKIFMKCAHKKRGAHCSIHEHSLCNVCIKNENFWSYRLHKLKAPQKCCGRKDRQTEWTHY